jgi:multicomponent Na+:H+ antiporter subunit C
MRDAFFWVEGTSIAITMGLGIYCLITQRNLFKMLIGLNILSKAAALCLAVGAADTGDIATGQSLMISVMLVEVVVTAVALSIMVNVYRHYGSLDTGDIKRLSG